MNGIHDMGGMDGMGPIDPEPNEPVFHEPWEGRVYAMFLNIRPWARGRNWPNGRYAQESLPTAEYLRMSYYERWFTMLVQLLLRSDLVTQSELDSGESDPSRPLPVLHPEPAGVAADAPNVSPRFRPEQTVRARNLHPPGHTRLPRYTRGKRGMVVRDHGVFPLQDTDTSGQRLGNRPQHVYLVRFQGRELWGDRAAARDSVYVDLWEDYLEPA